LIDAVTRTGARLNVFDKLSWSMNEIAADEIEKAGALIHHLEILESVRLFRMIPLVEVVSSFNLNNFD
jgi:hypothetical protein